MIGPTISNWLSLSGFTHSHTTGNVLRIGCCEVRDPDPESAVAMGNHGNRVTDLTQDAPGEETRDAPDTAAPRDAVHAPAATRWRCKQRADRTSTAHSLAAVNWDLHTDDEAPKF